MKKDIYDLAIVGGGIVGAAAMYKVQERNPHLNILLLEKEPHFAGHQTGNNSGVIHSGLYYKPGSLKAENCVQGRKMLVEFAKKYGIAHDVCGKVVVATSEDEFPFMNKIFDNGIANNTEGIEKVDRDKILQLEPECTGAISGIYVPCTGIIDYRSATEKMIELASVKEGNDAFTAQKLLDTIKGDEYTELICSNGRFKAKRVVYCAGLQADRLAQKDNVQLDMRVLGFRGDYYDLAPSAMGKVKNLIYPVPNPAFPFLGVHFTRMIHGGVECGPNAVFTFKREGYKKTSFNLKDTIDALTYIGTWKFFSKHWRFGLEEQRRAFSKTLFLKTLQRLIPSLQMDDLVEGRAGVRAMALHQEGSMIDDFKIEYKDNSIHVLNAPSPAATAALAIGGQISEMAEKKFSLK